MDWDQFTSIDLEALTTPEILERGIDYYRNGHLLTGVRIDHCLAGMVIGAGADYQVRLWIEAEKIQGRCSCPYPDFCKHLVALAYGWVENKAKFKDLRPLLDQALLDPTGLPALLTRLVYHDPLTFLQIADQRNLASRPQSGLPGTREMVNLIRNIFKTAAGNRLNNVEALWDQLARAEKLLAAELTAGNREALELLLEMFQGITAIYKANRLPELAAYFRGLLSLSGQMAHHFTKDDLAGLYQIILQDYFDPALLEVTEALKEVVICFYAVDPAFLVQYLVNVYPAENINNDSASPAPDIRQLINIYELLTTSPLCRETEANPQLKHYPELVSRRLKATTEGRLWLIDRLVVKDPGAAYRLAKTALLSGMEPKRLFRDRLIMFHWRRNEFKQAASLSFIQFQTEPGFEEYLRLKAILKDKPADWRSYLNQLQTHLKSSGDETLALKIALDQGDCGEVLRRVLPTETSPATLVAVAGLFMENISPEIVAAYPQLIHRLLAEQIYSCWNAALRLIIVYKKRCLQTGQTDAWEDFRTQLMEEYREDRRFRRKFGGILNWDFSS